MRSYPQIGIRTRWLAHFGTVGEQARHSHILAPQPLGLSGSISQELTVSQTTDFVPRITFQLDPNEGYSHIRVRSGHSETRGQLQSWSLFPCQIISEDAGSHGLCISCALVGPAAYVAATILAEIPGSSPCLASQTPTFPK